MSPSAPVDPQVAVDPPGSPTLGAVAHGLVSKQLAALLEHEAPARVGKDPEAVHQMRVATRRLRAGLKMFAETLPVPDAELRSELKWLADQLGVVRDVDVQIGSLRHVAAELGSDAQALASVVQVFEARHSTGREALVEALDGPRYTALVSSLSAVIAQPPAMWRGRARLPAADVLPELLRPRYRRYRKAAKRARATSDASELHRVRIRAKQLRYGLEFAARVYGKPARSLIERIVRVQDVLGEIQDLAVMDQHLRSLGDDHSQLPAPSVFLLGQLDQCYAQRAETARGRIDDALAGVSRSRWRRLKRRFASAP